MCNEMQLAGSRKNCLSDTLKVNGLRCAVLAADDVCLVWCISWLFFRYGLTTLRHWKSMKSKPNGARLMNVPVLRYNSIN